MKRKVARRPAAGRRAAGEATDRGGFGPLVAEVADHRETGPRLSGGDVDADWRRAHDAGDEAVGGSTATPDQDVVDEIGQALGIAQAADAEVQSSQEILRTRDRYRWHLEREAADRDEGRPIRHRRGAA
jgi:hypothetical protein